MIQRGEQLRLSLEARHALAIRDELLGQNLDRDVAPQLAVASPIDFAHPTRTEGRQDLVGA